MLSQFFDSKITVYCDNNTEFVKFLNFFLHKQITFTRNTMSFDCGKCYFVYVKNAKRVKGNCFPFHNKETKTCKEFFDYIEKESKRVIKVKILGSI